MPTGKNRLFLALAEGDLHLLDAVIQWASVQELCEAAPSLLCCLAQTPFYLQMFRDRLLKSLRAVGLRVCLRRDRKRGDW